MNFGDILIYVFTFFGIFTSLYFLLILFEAKSNVRRGLTKTYPSVSIIVPCFNESGTVIATIESLLNLDYDKNALHIYVVDDGSTDNTYNVVSKFIQKNKLHKRITLLQKENGGKYTALNHALKHINSKFVGVLDADSFVDKLALRRIIPFFHTKKVMAVTPSMKIYEPKTFLQRIQAIEFMIGIFLRKVFAELGSIHVTPGPFSIFRTKFIKDTGLYRKAHHTEDIEMALRIQRQNGVIENSVDAYVYTMGLEKFNDLLKQRLRWYAGFIKNAYDYRDLFSHKHGNLGIFILPSSFLSVFFVIVSLFYVLYKQISNIVNWTLNLIAVNFDLSQLKWFRFDWFYVNVNSVATISIISLLFGLLLLYISKKISGEKKSVAWSYIIYMVVYWFLFGFWWTLSIFRAISKKDRGWGHKSNQL